MKMYERLDGQINVEEVINYLLASSSRIATKYLSPNLIVRGTRRAKPNLRNNIDIVLTIGRPNYAERQFIKLAKKTGEKFPIRKVQLKPYSVKKR